MISREPHFIFLHFRPIMNYKYAVAVLLLIWGISGCQGCNKKKGRDKPDVSGINAEVSILRFDLDLQGFLKQDFEAHQQMMKNKYGAFYHFYTAQFIAGTDPERDSSDVAQDIIIKYLSDPYIHRVQDSINKYYADTKDIEKDLSQALKYFKYYFPTISIPKVITVNSGFSLSAFTYDEKYLAIGLEMYLGPQNPDYDSVGIYQYLRHKMSREYIARNSMEALCNLYLEKSESSRENTLMEAMVEKGKKLYLLSYLFPDAPDSLLVGFTTEQTLWCEQNDYEVWKFLNDKDILYKSDFMDQKRYLDEGPTTQGMPAEAPGNIGSWLGLQIVRKFVKESGRTIPLSELILKYDPKTIAAKAKYRPSKSVF
ncbi:MAG: hypothetical protein IPP77_12355 [Bacteroidetes bacterium]|nr:hypothetical protein [Bacteroidota bacterium]